MKFKIKSETNSYLAQLSLLNTFSFAEVDKAGNLCADVNITDLAQISHKAGYPLKIEFNDRTGYVITILDGE